AWISSPGDERSPAVMKEARTGAQALGIKLQVVEARTSGELEERFKALARERPGALRVMGDRLFLHNRERIMDFAAKQRLPVVPTHPELVEAGGVMSFGPRSPSMHGLAA